MIIHRHSREFYRLEIVTEPAVTGWEASFDGGTTWDASTVVDGFPAWLVAGTAAAVGTAVAVLADSVTPLLRVIDTPEIVVREGPKIFVQ